MTASFNGLNLHLVGTILVWSNAPHLYSRGNRFEILTINPNLTDGFLSLSKQIPGQYLELDHYSLLQNLYVLVTHDHLPVSFEAI